MGNAAIGQSRNDFRQFGDFGEWDQPINQKPVIPIANIPTLRTKDVIEFIRAFSLFDMVERIVHAAKLAIERTKTRMKRCKSRAARSGEIVGGQEALHRIAPNGES